MGTESKQDLYSTNEILEYLAVAAKESASNPRIRHWLGLIIPLTLPHIFLNELGISRKALLAPILQLTGNTSWKYLCAKRLYQFVFLKHIPQRRLLDRIIQLWQDIVDSLPSDIEKEMDNPQLLDAGPWSQFIQGLLIGRGTKYNTLSDVGSVYAMVESMEIDFYQDIENSRGAAIADYLATDRVIQSQMSLLAEFEKTAIDIHEGYPFRIYEALYNSDGSIKYFSPWEYFFDTLQSNVGAGVTSQFTLSERIEELENKLACELDADADELFTQNTWENEFSKWRTMKKIPTFRKMERLAHILKDTKAKGCQDFGCLMIYLQILRNRLYKSSVLNDNEKRQEWKLILKTLKPMLSR
ncbi:MAG: hypothetical protein AAGH72_00940 [Verrucomicrobiota bacterium]